MSAANGVNGNLIHLANRKVGKSCGKSYRRLRLLIGAVSHGTARVYVNSRVHLPLVKVELLIELIKSGVGVPIYLRNVVARHIVSVIRKFTGGAEIFASAVAAKHSGHVVFE